MLKRTRSPVGVVAVCGRARQVRRRRLCTLGGAAAAAGNATGATACACAAGCRLLPARELLAFAPSRAAGQVIHPQPAAGALRRVRGGAHPPPLHQGCVAMPGRLAWPAPSITSTAAAASMNSIACCFPGAGGGGWLGAGRRTACPTPTQPPPAAQACGCGPPQWSAAAPTAPSTPWCCWTRRASMHTTRCATVPTAAAHFQSTAAAATHRPMLTPRCAPAAHLLCPADGPVQHPDLLAGRAALLAVCVQPDGRHRRSCAGQVRGSGHAGAAQWQALMAGCRCALLWSLQAVRRHCQLPMRRLQPHRLYCCRTVRCCPTARLSLVTEMTKHIRVRASGGSDVSDAGVGWGQAAAWQTLQSAACVALRCGSLLAPQSLASMLPSDACLPCRRTRRSWPPSPLPSSGCYATFTCGWRRRGARWGSLCWV